MDGFLEYAQAVSNLTKPCPQVLINGLPPDMPDNEFDIDDRVWLPTESNASLKLCDRGYVAGFCCHFAESTGHWSWKYLIVLDQNSPSIDCMRYVVRWQDQLLKQAIVPFKVKNSPNPNS